MTDSDDGRSGDDTTTGTDADGRETAGNGPAGNGRATAREGRSGVGATAGEGERTAGDHSRLATRRRRALRRELAAAEDPIDVRTLANRIAAEEYDPAAESSVFRQCQRVLVSLQETHLPAMNADGDLDYDRTRGLVSPGEQLARDRADGRGGGRRRDGRDGRRRDGHNDRRRDDRDETRGQDHDGGPTVVDSRRRPGDRGLTRPVVRSR